jgi:DnaJ-class molecular chaperone
MVLGWFGDLLRKPYCPGRLACRSVEIKIPPGVEDGMQMQVSGRGNAGHNGGPAGNLFVIIQVRYSRTLFD